MTKRTSRVPEIPATGSPAAETRFQPLRLTEMVSQRLGKGGLKEFIAWQAMIAALRTEWVRRFFSADRFFARSMFPLKIVHDIVNLNPESEEAHDRLGGASGVWSHEAEFSQELSISTLILATARTLIGLEEQQQKHQTQLKEAFQAMQKVGEIPSHVTFEDRFKHINPLDWVNRLGRKKIKATDLCLLPQEQKLRPRTEDELHTIQIVVKDKNGNRHSSFHRFSNEKTSAVHSLMQGVMPLFSSEPPAEDIGKPVEHPLFVIEIDPHNQTEKTPDNEKNIHPLVGEREAIANQASLCSIALSPRGVRFCYPHFGANEDQGWENTAHILQNILGLGTVHLKNPTLETAQVLDRRYGRGPDPEKLSELEVRAGFTFTPEENAWHSAALKPTEQTQKAGASAPATQDGDKSDTLRPSFVQLLGMAQGFLLKSTTYLCVSAKEADLQLALLPFIGEEETIPLTLKKLQALGSSLPEKIDELIVHLSLDSKTLQKDFQKITSFTNQDIAECREGQGPIAQLYVSTHKMAKALFAQLFSDVDQRLQNGAAQISSVFHNDPPYPTVFTTAIDRQAPFGIGVKTEKFADGTSNRQLTLRSRLETESIEDLQAKFSTEEEVTQAALTRVERQTQELRRTMIDLSFILRLSRTSIPQEQQALFDNYKKLIAQIQPHQAAAETIVSRPEKLRQTTIATPDATAIPEPDTTTSPRELALIVRPPVPSALIPHPTLGSTAPATEKPSPSSLAHPSDIIPSPTKGSAE